MKVRTTTRGTPLGVKLTALCWGALTLLVPVAVSACTSNSSSTPTVPTFSPSVTVTTVPASGASTPADGTITATATGIPVATATATATATVTVTPATQIPTAAPVTGGGGTAGLQDGLLFVVGAAAILAGAGSIMYRRLTRGR